MRRALMAVACLFVGFGVTVAQDYTGETWYTHPVRQTLNVGEELSAVAVSPSGNQIAFGTGSRLVLRRVNDNGTIGDKVKSLSLGRVRRVAFSPDGIYVMAVREDSVVIVTRDSWVQRTVDLPHMENTCAVDTISQRPEVYVQSVRDVRFAGIDFLNARLFLDYLHPAVKTWSGAGLVAAPDASRVYSMWAESYVGNHCVMAHTVTPTSITLLWTVFVNPSQAMCIGPDPNHIMLATSLTPAHLIVMRGVDGSVVDHYDIPLPNAPFAIANSRDGRFVVVVGGVQLVTISGADIRGLVDPQFDIEEADVRTHAVALGIDAMGTCLHPTKDVAYAWSPNEGKLKVVCIGLPNV